MITPDVSSTSASVPAELADGIAPRRPSENLLPPVVHRNPAHSPFKDFLHKLEQFFFCKTHVNPNDAPPQVRHADFSATISRPASLVRSMATSSAESAIEMQIPVPPPVKGKERMPSDTIESVLEPAGPDVYQSVAQASKVILAQPPLPTPLEIADRLIATLVNNQNLDGEKIGRTLKELDETLRKLPDREGFIASKQGRQLRDWWGEQAHLVPFNALVFRMLVTKSDAQPDARVVRHTLERLRTFSEVEQVNNAVQYVANTVGTFSDREMKDFLIHFLSPQPGETIRLNWALQAKATQHLVYEIVDELLNRQHTQFPAEETARKVLAFIIAASKYASLSQQVTATVKSLSLPKATELLRHTLQGDNLVGAMAAGKNTPKRLIRVVEGLISRVPSGQVWQTCGPLYDKLSLLIYRFPSQRDNVFTMIQRVFSKITQNEDADAYRTDPQAFGARLRAPAEMLAHFDPQFAETSDFAGFVDAIDWLANTLQTDDDISLFAPTNQGMTQMEAAEILGVGPHADPAEINTAYRKKVLEVHPDKGGTSAAFQRVDDARKTLLQQF